MENPNTIWLIGLLALAAGILIGALAYRIFAPSVKQADKVKSDLDAAREEMEQYKASVNEHFGKTSELVNDLTQNYVKVYRHLAEGAQTLGESRAFTNLLEQQPGKVSISVDEKSDAPEIVADEAVADAPAPAEPPAQEPGERSEPVVDAAEAETADSVAEAEAPAPAEKPKERFEPTAEKTETEAATPVAGESADKAEAETGAQIHDIKDGKKPGARATA